MQALQHQTGEGALSANKEVEIRSLRSEIDELKKQLAGQHAAGVETLEVRRRSRQVPAHLASSARVCVSDSGEMEKQLEDVSLARRDLEDSSRHIKTLERQMKSITQERDELHRVPSVLFLGRRLRGSASVQPDGQEPRRDDRLIDSCCFLGVSVVRTSWRPRRS